MGELRDLSVFARCVMTAVIAASAWCAPVAAQLTAGHVVSGQATISQPSATSTLIQQLTSSAIITWSGFSIPRGASVTFDQPSASAIALNRVLGGSPSFLLGTLSANGQVWLINPAGIVVGRGANISAAGVLLSTADIHNADFLAGNYSFDIPGNRDAGIVNRGTIAATGGGSVVLAAAQATNNGLIAASLGTVVVAGASTYAVDFAGDGLLSFAITGSVDQVIPGSNALVDNKGTISAQGGLVLLTARAAKGVLDNVINTSGIVEATSAANVNGKIVLSGEGGETVVRGLLDASGKGAGEIGGTIEVLGNTVSLAPSAKIDVSGDAGGGTALVGGDFLGAGPEQNAATTSIASGAIIDADAVNNGNGGSVAVWSDNDTTVNGSITARGGGAGGDGGYVETSGGALSFAGITIDLSAPRGQAGSWLLDPYNLTITAAGAVALDDALATTSVIIETGLSTASSAFGTVNTSGSGDITVASAINWNSGNSLTLSAYRNINVDASISNEGSGNITLRADNTGIDSGTVFFASGARVASSGAITILSNPSADPGNGTVNASSYTQPDNYSGDVSVGTLVTYMLVNNAADLQDIHNNLSGSYALGASITNVASTIANFTPIGGAAKPFTGVFDGLGQAIADVSITATEFAGFFGVIGPSATVENLNFANLTLNASNGSGGTGGIAAINYGTIANVSVSGTVTANDSSGAQGGLVGMNYGTITGSDADVTVIANSSTGGQGGLTGLNLGTVSQSSSTGSVTAGLSSGGVGGLVGWNSLTIYEAWSSDAVTVAPSSGGEGGLAGGNDGTIGQSFASGAVMSKSTSAAIGGLVAINGGSVTNSYWYGAATGVSVSAGGGMLQEGSTSLPTGFASTVWGMTTSGYPYLLSEYPTGPPQTVSGTAYSDYDTTPLPGTGVVLMVGGTEEETVTTDATGSYDFAMPAGTISAGGSNLLTYVSGASTMGNVLYDGATGSTAGLDLYGGYLRMMTGAGAFSTAVNNLAAACGCTGGSNLLFTIGSGTTLSMASPASLEIDARATNFTIDKSLTMPNGTLVIAAGGNATIGGAISVNGDVFIDAATNIIVDAPISGTGSGNLLLYADAAAAAPFTGATVSFADTGIANWSQSNGSVSIYYHPAAFPTATSYSSNVMLASGASLTAEMMVDTPGEFLNALGPDVAGEDIRRQVTPREGNEALLINSGTCDPCMTNPLDFIVFGDVQSVTESPQGLITIGALPGVTVSLLVNGVASGTTTSVGVSLTTAEYEFLLQPGSLPQGGASLLVALAGTAKGNSFIDDVTGSVTGLDIFQNSLILTSGSGTLSGILADLKTALGSNSGANFLFSLPPSGGLTIASGVTLTISSTASTLNLDEPLSPGGASLQLESNGSVTQSQPISVTTLDLYGATDSTSGNFTLTNSANAIATLEASAGTVTLSDASNLLLAGITANSLTITDSGTVTQSMPVTASLLELAGAGGTFTLTNAGNAVGTLVANTGAISLQDSANLTIASAGGADGVTTQSLTITDPGTVTINVPGDSTAPLGTASITAGNLTITSLGNISIAPLTISTTGLATIDAGGTVGISGTISVSGALTIDAATNIGILSSINGSGSGNLVLRADADAADNGTVVFGNGAVNWSGSTGNVTIEYHTAGYPTATNFTSYVLLHSGSSLTAYMLVDNATDLQNIEGNLSGTYALGGDIDATGTATWNGGAGFVPIGSVTTPFNGTLAGQGFAINGLTINAPLAYAGLFGVTGASAVIQNLGLLNFDLVDTDQTDFVRVGGLVGDVRGVGLTIDDITFSGTVTGYYGAVGGLIGAIETGTVAGSTGTAAVTEIANPNGGYAGGFVGYNADGIVITSGVTGSVIFGGAPNGFVGSVGGFAGYNSGFIDQSFATVAVEGPTSPNGAYMAGGLVGQNDNGSIIESYANGPVNAGNTEYVGGLVGVSFTGSSIMQSYASGEVNATYAGVTIGGLIGYNEISITNSYWDTTMTGQANGAGDGNSISSTLGLTPSQFTSGSLPAGFDPSVWGGVAGYYPYLLWQGAP
jgi:filamentous hemagglutinin family protein